MKIIIEHYNNIYSAEFANDSSADEVLYEFTKLMVNCGFSPEVIRTLDGGKYKCEYTEEERC